MSLENFVNKEILNSRISILFFPEIPKATFSWIPSSMKPFKLLNLMKDSILKSFLCMCFLLLVYFWCFFLFTRLLEVLRGRRTWLYPKLWKPGPLMTTWIMNGSLDQVIFNFIFPSNYIILHISRQETRLFQQA